MNPATGEQLTTVPDANAEDVDRAVRAARRAFESGVWRKMDVSARERIIWRIGELIEKNKEELGLLESLNNGKTFQEALRGDIPPTADIFYYYAGWARKIYGETIPVDGNFLNYTLREPVGVVGMITAWNYPMLLAAWKVAPALAAGCTMVIKPSEMTPLTTFKLAEYCQQAGVPDGVVNVVTGYGPTAGEALGRHMDVDKVAFTGSVRTARALLKASGESNLKRLSLELGGKSPNIVFPDADLERAAKSAFWGIYANKGEVCSAGSRLLVHEKIYDEFVGNLAERAQKMKVGDPLDPASEMGSQISQAQMERILTYIESGRSGRRASVDRRRARRGRRQGPRILREAHRIRGCPAANENRAGRDFRPGARGAEISGCGGSRGNRQLHDLRIGFRRVDARHRHSASAGAANQGRLGLDQRVQLFR